MNNFALIYCLYHNPLVYTINWDVYNPTLCINICIICITYTAYLLYTIVFGPRGSLRTLVHNFNLWK